MKIHSVKVYASSAQLPREEQLAWKIASVAADDVPIERDVADDSHPQAFESREAVEDGARVEQRLRGMLVRAIARVDDRDLQMTSQKLRGAGGCVN